MLNHWQCDIKGDFSTDDGKFFFQFLKRYIIKQNFTSTVLMGLDFQII